MSCRFIKNSDGDITGALTEQGGRSQLFDNLEKQFGREKAIELYEASQSDEFKELFDTEPNVENVVRFVINDNRTEEELTKEHIVDLQDFNNVNKDEFLNLFYDKNGIFQINVDKLVKSDYYSKYEAQNLQNNIELQEKVKDSLERLKNTEIDLNTELPSREKISEVNLFGKLKTINPFTLENQLLNDLVDLNREDFDSALAEKELQNIDADKLFEDLQKYRKSEVFVADQNGEIRPKKVTETEMIIPTTVKVSDSVRLMKNLQGFISLRLDVLQRNEQDAKEILAEIEKDLLEEGLDVIGLENMPIDESLMVYLNTLNTFLISPTKENTKVYAELSDNFFNKDLSQETKAVIGEKNREYVTLDTDLSEEEVYNKAGLIKVEGDKWIKTAKEDLQTIYDNVRTYTEKYPKDKTLEEYVQEQITDYDFSDAEVAEAVVLYKMYFDVKKLEQQLLKDKNGNLLAPNGKVSNLNEQQYKLVRTSEFKAWFGDWQNNPQNASKVVDENGEPLVVYHGTNAKFYEFQNKIGIRGNQFTGSREVKSDTFFFTDDLGYANKASNIRKENFGGSTNIVSSFLNIRQPLDFSTFDYKTEEKFNEITGEYPSQYFGYSDNLDQWWRLFDKDEDDVTNIVKEKGYNGVVLAEEVKTVKDKDNYDVETASVKSFGVFNPNQIKSATEIKGTTTEDTNDIRFLKSVTPIKQTSNFEGDYNYLTNEFIADFHAEYLKEKKKDSLKYKNFYSNFTFNEKGIKIKSEDEITLNNIRTYASENLIQYSILSKQMPNLSTNTSSQLTSARDTAINNPQTVEKFDGQIFKLNDNEVILKNNTEEFIKIGSEIYESIGKKGNLNHFIKLEKSAEYNKVNTERPKSKLDISDYNYLEDKPESFMSVKKYLKGDIEGFDC